MNALAERIARLIGAQGPISVAQFMTLALHDPALGYYAMRDPLGAGGDFITAPQVSQMFGELLGLWTLQVWRDQGRPSPARLVELGPGHGEMMADVLRAAAIDPHFLAAIEVVLVEASPRLRATQRERLQSGGEKLPPVRWCDRFEDSLADQPLFLLANEFFDALPIRQFVMSDGGWRERMVGLNGEGALASALSPIASAIDIPAARGTPEPGAVYEVSPVATALVQEVARAVAGKGGAALIVDYGYGEEAGFGETLQAVSRHAFSPILEAPGEADLSAHVDFAALAHAAHDGGATAYGPVEQGAFLTALGIMDRAETLAQQFELPSYGADHLSNSPTMRSQLERLILPEQMGTLFKALAIVPRLAPKPPGF